MLPLQATSITPNCQPVTLKLGLEGYVRDWADLKGEIYIISGVIFDKDNDGLRDDDSNANRMASDNGNKRVAVPTHFYKIVAYESPSSFIETITFLLPHRDSSPKKKQAKAYLQEHLAAIDEVEKLTGVDYLTELEDRKETAVERFKAQKMWPTK